MRKGEMRKKYHEERETFLLRKPFPLAKGYTNKTRIPKNAFVFDKCNYNIL